MRERLQAFALSLHPEKTRLIEFGRFAAENRKRRGRAAIFRTGWARIARSRWSPSVPSGHSDVN
jgi:hypothetical protein